MPEISIILVTYNRAHLLPRMIASIKAQTFSDYEVVLINNGSTDSTDSLCRQYQAEDPRVKLITLTENRGAAPARNIGLQNISGNYVTMVDDDDFCRPEMLEHLYGMIRKYHADISVTGSLYEYSDGKTKPKYVYDRLYLWKGTEGLSEFLKREKVNTAPAGKLFRRRLFDGKRWTEGTRVDDIHFVYKLFADAQTVVAQGKPTYHFYKHTGNMTGFLSGNRLRPEVLDDYLAMQDERVAYISEHCPALQKQVRYARVSYMISMVERIEHGDSTDCETQLSYMKEYLKNHRDELLDQEWTTDRERLLFQKFIG